jgi:hypothetical protein
MFCKAPMTRVSASAYADGASQSTLNSSKNSAKSAAFSFNSSPLASGFVFGLRSDLRVVCVDIAMENDLPACRHAHQSMQHNTGQGSAAQGAPTVPSGRAV